MPLPHLHLVAVLLASGLRMPDEYNDNVNIFLPKGSEAADEQETVREPMNTRPIALKNADNKIICAAVNNRIRHKISESACWIQRGFIAGRHFVRNIVELDDFLRKISMQAVPGELPRLAFFDVSTAFASVIHSWIFLLLRRAGWPVGLVNLIEGTYHNCHACVSLGGASAFMCEVRSGVLQGCPLSGSIPALAVEPLLNMFLTRFVEPALGHVLACADDVGAVVKRLEDISVLVVVFELAEKVAGLTLKPSKCILVPIHAPFSCHLVSLFRDVLVWQAPAWAGFQINPCAKYLAFGWVQQRQCISGKSRLQSGECELQR